MLLKWPLHSWRLRCRLSAVGEDISASNERQQEIDSAMRMGFSRSIDENTPLVKVRPEHALTLKKCAGGSPQYPLPGLPRDGSHSHQSVEVVVRRRRQAHSAFG